ncbi:YceD family protein [Arabiibacter massiliensis]|uniref:YceD family protein n=1 Tax=Arabiibacter massiliensis TaxID=1870985 RepID=UPI0009BA4B55|nr:YceD family protein [Arabiibacter massiliensis]
METRILVPNELFAPAESSHFEGWTNIPVMKAGPDLYDFEGPLAWQVDISNTGDALLVTGTVEGEAKTACARCLDEFSFEVTGEIEGYFLLDGEKDAPEDMDDDEFDVLPEDRVIDLEPLITAALMLEFPLVPLCDDDCKGLCATCGANLNEGPCGCAPAEDAGDDAPPNPFSVLKDFPFDEK